MMEQVTQCFATDTHTPKMLHKIVTDARAWIQTSVSPTNRSIPTAPG
jgi:hypothetical protein